MPLLRLVATDVSERTGRGCQTSRWSSCLRVTAIFCEAVIVHFADGGLSLQLRRNESSGQKTLPESDKNGMKPAHAFDPT